MLVRMMRMQSRSDFGKGVLRKSVGWVGCAIAMAGALTFGGVDAEDSTGDASGEEKEQPRSVIEELEAKAKAAEEEVKEVAEEAVGDLKEAEEEAEEKAGAVVREGEKLGKEAVERVEEAARDAAKYIRQVEPEVEERAHEIGHEVADWLRAVEPGLIRKAEAVAEEAEGKSEQAVAEVETSSREIDLWMLAHIQRLEREGKLVINDAAVELNSVEPSLGTEALDVVKYLERATVLPIREGTTDAEREGSRLLEKTRRDLEKAGHWVSEEAHRGEDALESESLKLKRKLLAEENKLDFWLEGRPLDDVQAQAVIAHNNLLVSEEFPSATSCAECHPGQYRQWSVSAHAYAQLSPVFNAMSERINRLTNGTNGDFCIRCHNQVGMAIEEPIFIGNADRLPVTREGVSCIVCHRVKNAYGRVSGRLGIEKGNLTQPMYGPLGPEGLEEVLKRFNVTTDAAAGTFNWKKDGAQVIHDGAVKVKTFASAQLCSNCHDVNGQNVFRLEEAYSQFRNSPAAAEGHVCQDCHMGKVLGKVSGYDEGPIAYIGGVPTPSGKRTNHMFAGPDYTIVHPGIFPHNPESEAIASFVEWLEFNVAAEWGTEEFEKQDHDPSDFPPAWRESRHRRRANEFIQGQLRLIGEYRAQQFRTLRYGYQLGEFRVNRNDGKELAFEVDVKNATTGHGVPTGFDAERTVFLQVTVTDRDGKVVFRSGDRDPNGDVRDLHSEYVRDGKVPLDRQLFSLQSKFLELALHGGERERILPIPVSQGPLPFLRPNTSSSLLLAHPTATRKQATIIPPLGTFVAGYKVPAQKLTGNGPYRVRLTFIAQMVPVNLVNEISSVGFDYNLSARDVANRVVLGGFPLWDHEFEIGPAGTVRDLTPSDKEIMGPEAVTPALPWLKHEQSFERIEPGTGADRTAYPTPDE